ncbi:hypothetical protein FOZ76_12105 [Verticiella sediminum]|uniref:Inner membrane protein n=1 Tax=Verticiella sediminum TaxID=1247510 RepID=A0A556ANK0_9BURK|nr:hypothetical protein [Verticiella sediminum]TSH94463.1 hypothetical protein FOZ76_12105 [Verticiella sediminum]
MFGRKPAPFKPYAFGAKPKRKFPRWPILLVIGIVLGGAAVLLVQEEYLPPRLSPQESARLTETNSQLNLALQQTRNELEQAREALARQQAESVALAEELETARAELQPLQDDLALLKDVLPPDPRGGALQIRAGRFLNEGSGLDYHIVLTRQQVGKPFKGAVQFVVEGRYPSGRPGNVTLGPIPLEMGDYRNVHGSAPLPDGMQARQITVRVLDGGERMQAMRVINSRN